MHHAHFNQADRVELMIPYEETVTGRAYFTCYKDSDMSKADFVAGVKAGSIDPLAFAYDESWKEVDSDGTRLFLRELEDLEG